MAKNVQVFNCKKCGGVLKMYIVYVNGKKRNQAECTQCGVTARSINQLKQ